MSTPRPAPSETETFDNAPIAADDLPQVDAQSFSPLDPAYARVRAIGAAVTLAVIVVMSVVAWVLLSTAVALAVGGVVASIALAVGVAQRIATNHMGFLVRAHDVSFSSGVIGRSVATAPFARVQHVSIQRGPVDRRFGLAALQLRTAGGHLTIPGLRNDVAERLKQLVSDRASALADAERDTVADTGSVLDPGAADAP